MTTYIRSNHFRGYANQSKLHDKCSPPVGKVDLLTIKKEDEVSGVAGRPVAQQISRGVVDAVGQRLAADDQLLSALEVADELKVGLCVRVGGDGHFRLDRAVHFRHIVLTLHSTGVQEA